MNHGRPRYRRVHSSRLACMCAWCAWCACTVEETERERGRLTDRANFLTVRRNTMIRTAVVRLACPPPASRVQWQPSISSLPVALADHRFLLKQTWWVFIQPWFVFCTTWNCIECTEWQPEVLKYLRRVVLLKYPPPLQRARAEWTRLCRWVSWLASC